jgi:multidrug efflux pump subunit AcrA (membrane-fusion protein)
VSDLLAELEMLKRAREARESDDPRAAARIVSAWTDQENARKAAEEETCRAERALAHARAEAAEAQERAAKLERENRALSSELAEQQTEPELPEGVKDIRDKILKA